MKTQEIEFGQDSTVTIYDFGGGIFEFCMVGSDGFDLSIEVDIDDLHALEEAVSVFTTRAG